MYGFMYPELSNEYKLSNAIVRRDIITNTGNIGICLNFIFIYCLYICLDGLIIINYSLINDDKVLDTNFISAPKLLTR